MRSITLAAWLLAVPPALAAAPPAQDWPGWGGPLPGNQRFAAAEDAISPATASGLRLAWSFAAHGNITSTPSVAGGAVVFDDDWGGIYSLDAATGRLRWMRWMSSTTGQASSYSRSSPAIAGGLVIVADRRSGTVAGLDRGTGVIAWTTVIDTNPYVTLTASPMVYDGKVYIGTSSNEEYQVSVQPGYVARFRGSVVALDAANGHMLWRAPMVPAGYTGGAVWGSGLAVAPLRGLLYAATGNNYSLPPAAAACARAAPSRAAQMACLDRTDYVDAVVALDMATGVRRWDVRLGGLDTYTLNCRSSPPAQPCPTPTGRDFDFASAPAMISIAEGGLATQLVGAGQKSGIFWALKPESGAVAWHSWPGPGGTRGGIMWGAAADTSRVYIAENDSAHTPYRLGPGNTVRITGGSWAALDGATGHIVWQVAVPGTAPGQTGVPAGAESAMTVANGVVFGGTTGGDMVALDAASGATLWDYHVGAGIICGPAVSNGMVFWGSGDPYGATGNTLYAFKVAPANTNPP